MQANKITITGALGAGKSSVSKYICQQLGFEYFSTGMAQRTIAEKRGMTTLELNQFSETNREIDDEIDSVFGGFSKSLKGMVIDSRLAWHFLPGSFKVYLNIDETLAAERIVNDGSRDKEQYDSVELAILKLRERRSSEVSRFKEIYKVDCGDMKNFDLVVNVTNLTIEQAGDKIIRAFRSID